MKIVVKGKKLLFKKNGHKTSHSKIQGRESWESEKLLTIWVKQQNSKERSYKCKKDRIGRIQYDTQAEFRRFFAFSLCSKYFMFILFPEVVE